jgi:putative endonuclease
MEHFVYILYSSSIEKYYVGMTSNPSERLTYHNSENNSIWTRRGKPWELKKVLPFPDRSSASKAERFIKQQKSRVFIEKLVTEGWKVQNI